MAAYAYWSSATVAGQRGRFSGDAGTRTVARKRYSLVSFAIWLRMLRGARPCTITVVALGPLLSRSMTMRSLPARRNSRLRGVCRSSSHPIRLRLIAMVANAATRVRSTGEGKMNR